MAMGEAKEQVDEEIEKAKQAVAQAGASAAAEERATAPPQPIVGVPEMLARPRGGAGVSWDEPATPGTVPTTPVPFGTQMDLGSGYMGRQPDALMEERIAVDPLPEEPQQELTWEDAIRTWLPERAGGRGLPIAANPSLAPLPKEQE